MEASQATVRIAELVMFLKGQEELEKDKIFLASQGLTPLELEGYEEFFLFEYFPYLDRSNDSI